MKTKVSIIRDVNQSQIKKGENGYIDGYITGGDGRPYAVVVVGLLIELIPIHDLLVLEDTNVWTCEKCQETVEGYNVTYSEIHVGCGGKCS